jgi:hypothetical protein
MTNLQAKLAYSPSSSTDIGGRFSRHLIARYVVGQGGVKSKAPSRQRIERTAGAPVERQEAACLTGCRRGHLGPFHDDDVDPAATEEIGGAGADLRRRRRSRRAWFLR